MGVGEPGDASYTISAAHEHAIYDARSFTLKIRGGADTYRKPDGSIGTAGKGPLVQEERSGTLGVTQDQTLFVLQSDGTTSLNSNGCGYKKDIGYTLNQVDRQAAVDFRELESEESGTHAPAVVYDCRGLGNGETVPTLTGGGTSHISHTTAVIVEAENDVSESDRNS